MAGGEAGGAEAAAEPSAVWAALVGPSIPPSVSSGVATWASGEEVAIKVQDTGVGMDDDTRARLFQPFFTTKQVGEGTGLGLAVVHGIVNAHGGRIDVASTPGRGSTFTVWLPKNPPARGEAATRA